MSSSLQLFICAFLLGAVTTAEIILIRSNLRKKATQKNKQSANFWQKLQLFLMWVQALWYPILIIGFAIYLIFHYPDCKEFTFLNDFQGDNLIFILWLVLLILPIFSKLKIFGITIEFWGESELSKYMADRAKDTQHIATVQELEAERNKGKEDNNGK